MQIVAVTGDITTFEGDALVNAANPALLGGGGVDGAIHRAAGPALLDFCRNLPQVEPGIRCRVGEVRVTPGFNLHVQHVIHTVGPMFPTARQPMFPGEAIADQPTAVSLLTKCLTTVLVQAAFIGAKTLAIPAVSCGVYGCDIPCFVEALKKVAAQVETTVEALTVYLFNEVDRAQYDAALERLAA